MENCKSREFKGTGNIQPARGAVQAAREASRRMQCTNNLVCV
ncbi:MAG: DUF1559 domain-containing protein [Thermoguttaceae bacterium]|nr:DUF1559 domain-containing protein [Thermoguttaceae bacterium]